MDSISDETLAGPKGKMKTSATRIQMSWPGVLFWVSLTVIGLLFLSMHLAQYFVSGLPEFFGESLLDKKLWFYLHITGGALVIIIGPLQFWKFFRLRYPRVHKASGKLYIIGTVAAVAGLVRIIPEGLCKACQLSQTTVTILWIVCTLAAWVAIRAGNVAAHRQFMARSYLFAFYFVAVRILGALENNLFLVFAKDGAWYANTDWFVWVVPFIILEAFQTWWPSLKGRR